MYTHHLIPVVLLHFQQRLVAQDARIVDQDVHAAEGIERCLQNRDAAGDAAHIGHRGDRPSSLSANFLDRGLCGRRGEVVHDHGGALLRQQARVTAAEAGPGTGDHRHFSIQQCHCSIPSVMRGLGSAPRG